MKIFWPRLSVIALLLFVLAVGSGCDATTTQGTVALSDPQNPTEETFEFSYARDDYDSSTGTVTVSASALDNATTPDLDTILQNGYFYDTGRSIITSAAVEGVQITNLTAAPAAKVFPYLNEAEIYLQSQSGPLVASGPVPESGPATLTPTSAAGNVTQTLKAMAQTTAVLVLDVEEASSIPTESEGGDRIEAMLTYTIRAPQQ